MKHATSIALHEYWRSCHDRAPVSAGQIRAGELTPILPSLFLLDLDIAGGLPFRFCGANIARRYGRDLSEESFLALWGQDDRQAIERHLSIMSGFSGGLVAGVMAETVGGGFTAYEILLLPLAGEAGPAGAIGSMERIGGHDEKNRIRARLVSQTLRSVRFLPSATRSLTYRYLADPPGTRPEASLARRRYGHLSVVNGGKSEAGLPGG
jgi:hypothetical protein